MAIQAGDHWAFQCNYLTPVLELMMAKQQCPLPHLTVQELPRGCSLTSPTSQQQRLGLPGNASL